MTALDDPVGVGPDADAAESVRTSGSGRAEEELRRYRRSPRALLRLVSYAVTTLLVVGLTIWAEDSVLGLEEDILALFDFLAPAIERVLHGSLEWIGFTIFVGIYLVPLVTKRYRLFLYLLTAGTVSFGLMQLTLWALQREEPRTLVNEIARRAGIEASTTSGAIGFAGYAASFVVLGPFVSSMWRRAGVIALGGLVLVRFLVSFDLPADFLVAIPLGAAVGAAVLLLFGRPDRRPTTNAIRLALIDTGLAVTEVHPALVDARGSTPYFATLDDGTRLFVKVLGEEERAADLMFRTYRFLRLKNVGDDRPFSSLRRTVEHEALVSLAARDVGVRTPRMRGIVRVGLDSMLLAYDAIDGTSVDGLDGDAITDDVLRQLFEQLAALRAHRIAHRDLRRANVFVDHDGAPWLIDFGFAELAVEQALLDADVAQALAAFSIVAGTERPVRIAIDVLGRDAVADALPRLQINALSGATRVALKERKGLLQELQGQVQQQAGVDQVRFAELARVDKKMILMVVVVVGATYFLLPQFSDLPSIVDQVKDADWTWAPLVVMASFLTYIGSAVALAGGVPTRVGAGPILVGQVASEFASKLAPAGIGGMALNIRLLQKQGVDRAVSVSGVGLSTVVGVVAHLSMIGVFILWAGRDAFGSFKLPDVHWFLIGGLAALVLVGIGLAIPFTRHVFMTVLVPILRRAFDGVNGVIRRPGKVAMLFGGSMTTTMGYLLALYFSVEAFGGGLSIASVGAVYLVGSAVAGAAPTPGGLGAMEAALIGGLVAAGLENEVAVPAVFLFRLVTFWLPILPGWISFQWLQRHDYI